MTRIVVGLDPSSRKIALSYSVDGEAPALAHKTLTLHDLPRACHEAFIYVRSFIIDLLQKHEDSEVYLFIEEPVVGRGGVRSTLQQARVGGAMIAGGVSGGASVHLVNNQTWKKRVVGNGNVGKPAIKKWCIEQWPYLYEQSHGDQDLIDAGCIMRHGQFVIELRDRIAAEREGEEEDEVPPTSIKRKKLRKKGKTRRVRK